MEGDFVNMRMYGQYDINIWTKFSQYFSQLFLLNHYYAAFLRLYKELM